MKMKPLAETRVAELENEARECRRHIREYRRHIQQLLDYIQKLGEDKIVIANILRDAVAELNKIVVLRNSRCGLALTKIEEALEKLDV